VAFAVQIWCIDRGGPVFVAVYQPVQTLVVAIMASLTLGEKFYLGGIIGAVLIVAGLYLVLWGKSEERARVARDAVSGGDREGLLVAAAAGGGGGGIVRSAGNKAASAATQPLLLPSSTPTDNV
jgi:hypothetical protein